MIVGIEKIREVSEAMSERLEDGESNELMEVDEVFIIVAVHYGTVDLEGEGEAGTVYYRCTSARPHVQFGLIEQTRRAIEETIRRTNA